MKKLKNKGFSTRAASSEIPQEGSDQVLPKDVFSFSQKDGIICTICVKAGCNNEWTSGKKTNASKMGDLKRHLAEESHVESETKLKNQTKLNDSMELSEIRKEPVLQTQATPDKVPACKMEYQNVWKGCPFCGWKYWDVEENSHHNQCSQELPLPVDSHTSLGLMYEREVLVARIEVNDEVEERIPKKYADDPIYMNSSTMCEMKLWNGHPVVVNNHIVGILIENDRLPLSSIAVRTANMERIRSECRSEFVVLRPLPRPYLEASEVHVTIVGPHPPLNSDVLQTLKFKYVEKFVRAGSVLQTSVFLRPYKLRVVTVVRGKGATAQIESEQEDGATDTADDKSWMFAKQDYFKIVETTIIAWTYDMSKLRTVESIGGYEEQKMRIKEFLLNAEKLERDEKGPLGLLLYGPHGTGKSILVDAFSRTCSLPFCEIDITDLCQCTSEDGVVLLVRRVALHEPCVIVLDRMDVFCSSKEPFPKGATWNIANGLLSAMEQLKKRRVYFIGISRELDDVHPDFLDYSRFGIHVELGLPSIQQKVEILKICLHGNLNNLQDADIRKLSEESHGFSGMDLDIACRRAFGLAAVRQERNPKEHCNEVVITVSDMMKAVKALRAHNMQYSSVTCAPVNWNEIGGQRELKDLLTRIIEEAVASTRDANGPSQQHKGILLYGPPGCCKTMIARAVATQYSASFFSAQASDLLSKYVGESERMVRQLFASARQAAPSVIFLDEIDAIASTSDGSANDVTSNLVTTLLSEIDGIQELRGVVIIASTNTPHRINPALLIPSRVGLHYYVRIPDSETRREILELQFLTRPIAEDVNVEELVCKTEGFSGAEVVGLCSNAASRAMIEDFEEANEIKFQHFLSALDDITPLATLDMLDVFEKFVSAC